MEQAIGRQTPTQSIILPYKKSLGPKAIKSYQESKRTALEWQKLLISNIMAVDDSGLWTHATFGYEVPRQNGKGEVLTRRELEGLKSGERVIHTAHRTSTSHSAFVRLLKVLTWVPGAGSLCPPQVHVEDLTPKVIVSGGRTFGW